MGLIDGSVRLERDDLWIIFRRLLSSDPKTGVELASLVLEQREWAAWQMLMCEDLTLRHGPKKGKARAAIEKCLSATEDWAEHPTPYRVRRARAAGKEAAELRAWLERSARRRWSAMWYFPKPLYWVLRCLDAAAFVSGEMVAHGRGSGSVMARWRCPTDWNWFDDSTTALDLAMECMGDSSGRTELRLVPRQFLRMSNFHQVGRPNKAIEEARAEQET